MLFDASCVCRPVYCREVFHTAGTSQNLPDAPLAVVLASSGRAAAEVPGAEEPLWLAAGALLLAGAPPALTPATDCHLLAIGLAGSAAQQAAARLDGGALVSDCSVCPLAAQEAEALRIAFGSAPPEALGLPAYRLLCALAGADAIRADKRLPQLVTDAVLAIRQNYAGLYGVEELSGQLGVSKSHLVRVFHAEMGVGPGQYLTRVRLEAAKALLAHRDYSLEVIASLCGFSGANYLCKVFKKHEGVTPAVWRSAHASFETAPQALNALEHTLYT